MRLFLLIWLALSLAAAPGPAFAAPAPDCGMASSDMADHQKMGCCTPDCALASPAAAVLPSDLAFPAVDPQPRLTAAAPTEALPSVNPAATDPPPRTSFS